MFNLKSDLPQRQPDTLHAFQNDLLCGFLHVSFLRGCF